ncbi:MAG: tetratricopeptide repeat protein [Alphaproteobacteria bacterium]|nr:tetratricopeptide repeat protein [Pseudomonadota bacterium]TDI64478.1 MAG: tetratricopeptide repeat protein [Alphaproteobacteria bacterium]
MAHKILIAALLILGLASTAMAAGSSSPSRRPAPESNFDLGLKAVKAENFGRALGLLAKVVRSDPRNADAWNWIGFSNRKLERFKDSLVAYKKALAIDPDHRGANEYLGELYLKTGDLAKARVRLDRLDSICYFGCEEFDDLKRAIKAFEAAQGKG